MKSARRSIATSRGHLAPFDSWVNSRGPAPAGGNVFACDLNLRRRRFFLCKQIVYHQSCTGMTAGSGHA